MFLRTKMDSKFNDLVQQFAGMFSQHMRQHLNQDLGQRLSIAGQNSAHNIIRKMQQNNRIGDTEILVNKFVNSVCLVKVEDGSTAFAIEYDGTFYRQKEGIAGIAHKPEHSLIHGKELGKDIGIQMTFGKYSLHSLMSACFAEKRYQSTVEPIMMKVEDLEEFIEGYVNVFNEDDLIAITTQIERVEPISLDPTF
jgi:hypothetical protein